ncbi:MAG: hypothetical protein DCC55_16685 [Chloroflexi bacterium]|nr:MAG: hypothetical protein DCC55_16685 [Chloroflexota bacterium]
MAEHNPTNQVAYQPPAPDPELRRLEPLLGTWQVTGWTEESLAGPAGPVTSSETFDWLDGGYFLVQTYQTIFGDSAPQTGVNYWGYDAEADKFHIIFFSNNGPYTDKGNRYQGMVSDGKLTFTGPARFTIGLDADGKVQVNPDGAITFVWELRDSDGVWRHWMDNTYTRVQ